MSQETHLLTEEAWQRVNDAQPHFLELFALTDRGVSATDPNYQRIQRRILKALGIPAEQLHSIAALARICPAARLARGILRADWCDDLGGYLLIPVTRH